MDREKLNVGVFGETLSAPDAVVPKYTIHAWRVSSNGSTVQTEAIARGVEREFLIPLMSAAISAGWYSCRFVQD